jgi:acetylornithine/N-succinyldiaminopimelate aminotransferase
MSALLPVYERDLVIVSGKGVRVTDADGKTYLDFAAGIGVNGLGYGDPKVVAAIRKQAGRLIHASNLYYSRPVQALAGRLAALAFPSKVFFCNSGTEAVEAAMKFARRIGGPAGRTEFVAFERSFHGRTMGALSMTWTEKYRAPFEPLVPGVRFCPWDDLKAADGAIGSRTAAVFVEPVQGEGGLRVAPPEFLQGLADLCRERGALLVSEEVQCGLGRTGKLFAYEHAGIRPDMLTLAKPLGGGLPLGAVLLREELAPAIAVGDHGSTFGGNPVAAVAGLAVIAVIERDGLLANATAMGEHLVESIIGLGHRMITGVRGRGLLRGVTLTEPIAPAVADAALDAGFVINAPRPDVLRLAPPLVITAELLETFVAVLPGLLDDASARAAA